MANALMALGVQTPQINVMESFALGQQHAQRMQQGQLDMAAQNLSWMGQMAHDAQGDPAKWDQGIDMMVQAGFPSQVMDRFRGRVDLAPMLAKSVFTAQESLQNGFDERRLEQAWQRLTFDMQQAAKAPPPTAAQSNWDWAGDDPAKQAYLGIGQASGARPMTADERAAWGIPETDTGPYSIEPGKAPQRIGGNSQASNGIPMSATIQQEIFAADDAVLSGQSVIASLERALDLNETAFDGPWAEQRGYGAAMFGNEGGRATLELKNEVTAQALDQLKAIFGAMPTEGERKILLEIQGSADQPREVRKAIYSRAIEAANRRIAANQAKADALRQGTYFQSDYQLGGNVPGNTQVQPAGDIDAILKGYGL